MAKFLFLTWYGAGNQVPEIGAAQELRSRGHAVCFAGYSGQRDRFESHGFEFRILPRSDAAYRLDLPPEQILPALVGGVWACPHHLSDVPDVLTPDIDAVVVDCLLFGALAALQSAEVPVSVLVHSAPGLFAPPGAEWDQLMVQPVNAVRRAAGVPEVQRMWDTWAPFPTLCTSIEELDPLAGAVPPSFRYVGPVTETVPDSGFTLPWPEQDSRPLVISSFSTGPAWDQSSRIRRVIEGLGTGRYRLLVLTSMADVSGLAVPDGVAVQRHVPHREVLPAASVVVTHAGHGTVAAALEHGVPMVALPNPAADQPALAARVHELGAGIALDGETAGADAIAAAVQTILGDSSYAASAAALGERIRAAQGNHTIADMIEATLKGSTALT